MEWMVWILIGMEKGYIVKQINVMLKNGIVFFDLERNEEYKIVFFCFIILV